MLDNFFDLVNTFNKLVKNIKKKETELLSNFGLTHFHAKYISLIDKKQNITMTELNFGLGFDKANTTRVIKELLAKDIVIKSENERKFKLSLTNYGKQIATELKFEMTKYLNMVFAKFKPKEKEQFAIMLNKFLINS